MAVSGKKSVYRKKQYERHGLTAGGKKPPAEYVIWCGMVQRCEDAHCPLYKDYGGRGIRVCERWRTSFQAFLSDVGPRPGSTYSLERERNGGHYEPGNVRWATKKEQARNRRSTRLLSDGVETYPLIVWAERLGCTHSTIIKRIKNGWTERDAVTTPARRA